MNGDDYKPVYFPWSEQEEAWRNEARLLLDHARASRIGAFLGTAGSWLDCLQWANAYDVLIGFVPRRRKAAIRAKFAELEQHLAHNDHHDVGAVRITSASQEPDLLYRDVIQQPIFFPDTGIVWRTGEPEPERKEKTWLHSAQVAPREPELGLFADLVTPNFDFLTVDGDRFDQIALGVLHLAFPPVGEKAIVYNFYMLLIVHVGQNRIRQLTTS